MKRVHLIISGDVQGVGFRSFVKRVASEKSITGWVRNREDGAVEVVSEGPINHLKELIKACRQGPDVAWVKSVDEQWSEAMGEFVNFEVIY